MQRESGRKDAEGDGDERSLGCSAGHLLPGSSGTSLTTLSSLKASTPQRHLLRAQLVQFFYMYLFGKTTILKPISPASYSFTAKTVQ